MMIDVLLQAMIAAAALPAHARRHRCQIAPEALLGTPPSCQVCQLASLRIALQQRLVQINEPPILEDCPIETPFVGLDLRDEHDCVGANRRR